MDGVADAAAGVGVDQRRVAAHPDDLDRHAQRFGEGGVDRGELGGIDRGELRLDNADAQHRNTVAVVGLGRNRGQGGRGEAGQEEHAEKSVGHGDPRNRTHGRLISRPNRNLRTW